MAYSDASLATDVMPADNMNAAIAQAFFSKNSAASDRDQSTRSSNTSSMVKLTVIVEDRWAAQNGLIGESSFIGGLLLRRQHVVPKSPIRLLRNRQCFNDQ